MTRGPSTRNNTFSPQSDLENESSAKFGALLAGLGIAALGLTRKSATRVAMIATGATIASFALRDESSGGQSQSCSRAESSIIVDIPRERAYSFWRDFKNLPLFMNHLKSVEDTDGQHSRWIAYGPMNKEVEWDAEITEEQPNELIMWRSIEGSDVLMLGTVEFTDAVGKRGTLIEVHISYESPGGAVGNTAAKLLGKDPSFLMRQDMRRFKALMEAGEIPTTEGQTHGPRSALSGLFKAMNPDEPVKKNAGRTLSNLNKRRVS